MADPRRTAIERYFAACSAGEPAAVERCFTADAVVYDLNLPPTRTAAGIGAFWAKTHRAWQGASWHVDTCVEAGDAAAIEWTMLGHDRAGRPFAFRGSEHYRFEGDLIAEIRQYWHFDGEWPGCALLGFPYEADPRFAQVGVQ